MELNNPMDSMTALVGQETVEMTAGGRIKIQYKVDGGSGFQDMIDTVVPKGVTWRVQFTLDVLQTTV